MHALDRTPEGPLRATATISMTDVDLEKSSSSSACSKLNPTGENPWLDMSSEPTQVPPCANRVGAAKGGKKGSKQEAPSSNAETLLARDMEGAPSSSCYVAELCAGSAGLSFALSRAGFSTVTVDHAANRHKAKVPCDA